MVIFDEFDGSTVSCITLDPIASSSVYMNPSATIVKYNIIKEKDWPGIRILKNGFTKLAFTKVKYFCPFPQVNMNL
jgi:hypothetical protein